MKAVIKNIADVSCIGDTIEFTIVLDSCYRQALFELLNAMQGDDKAYTITIEKQKRKRSLNANAYMWQLCDQIARKVRTTKEIVYCKNIREVGSFEVLEMPSAGVGRFIRSWGHNGIGWLAEPIGERRGFTNVMAYYGSSTYTTAEMSRLIEAVVEEARGLGVETMTPAELAGLKAAWKGW